MSCISRRMGARRGRYLEGMVSINSFILPAVEIAWIDAFRVGALLPEIPAVAMPIAAGEAPLRGSEEEEEGFIFEEMGEGREGVQNLR